MNKSILVMMAFTLAASDPALARDKTDVVWLRNGDRLTGEIRQLEHGILRLGTDAMGEVRIEWDDVARVESSYEFQFERTDGTRVTGTIGGMSEKREIAITSVQTTVQFEHANLVRISQIEDSFWDRLKGSMNFGYSFTKASDVAQGNLGFRATHRTEVRSFSLDGSTVITKDQADENTQRSDVGFTATRFRRNRWFNSYVFGLESNDELGLNLRTSLGAGVGRYLVQTNTSELAVIGGLVGTAEELQQSGPDAGDLGEQTSKQSAEGLLGIEYARYIFDDPTVDLSVRLTAFPSISERGRTRAQFDINLRREVFNDLFWELKFYNTYDSDTPSGSKAKTDYGVVSSLGWSF